MSSDGKSDDQRPRSGSAKAPEDPISQQLRHVYQSVANESLPDELQALLERLKQTKR